MGGAAVTPRFYQLWGSKYRKNAYLVPQVDEEDFLSIPRASSI